MYYREYEEKLLKSWEVDFINENLKDKLYYSVKMNAFEIADLLWPTVLHPYLLLNFNAQMDLLP